jgi:type II secretory pathway pseudopilin PulG
MAADLMLAGGATFGRRRQAGFSMVEMLMTAFIMAVGIMGLTALMVMSLRAIAGSRRLGTAILVAEQVLDQAELEGRLSRLNIADSSVGTPTPLTGLRYVGLEDSGEAVNSFDIRGVGVPNDSTEIYFRATTTRAQPVSDTVSVRGHLSALTVVVTFTDEATAAGVAIPRTVRLTRMVSHG